VDENVSGDRSFVGFDISDVEISVLVISVSVTCPVPYNYPAVLLM